MTTKKVLVTDFVDKKGIELLKTGAEVIYLPELPDRTFLGEVGQVHAILVRGVIKINHEAIEKGKNLQIVAKHGVGVDNIDIEACTEKGIVVTNTPAANSESVVEHTLGLMLSVSRYIAIADRLLRQGKLAKRENYTGVELMGKTLGVIGMGRIGAELARKCKVALDMPIVCFDPYMTKERATQLGYNKVEKVGDLLAESDFVSICTPLTKETANLIGAKEMALMKPTSFLINCARGGIVDEAALYDCLSQKKIAGAGFDTFVIEPPPANHPLLSLDNFVATNHFGGITKDAMVRMATTGAEEILRVLKGQKPLYALNPEVYKSK
jgi:D-3-phosphoglycerate dehydrogenase